MVNNKEDKAYENLSFCSRRKFIERLGGGFGMLALSSLLPEGIAIANSYGHPEPTTSGPLSPKPPHYPVKAKSIIFLFMHGGASHIDTFDPKPLLQKYDGQKLPPSFGNIQLQFTNGIPEFWLLDALWIRKRNSELTWIHSYGFRTDKIWPFSL
jgi:hypothetical protein